MILIRMATPLRRARDILQTGGPIPLAKRGFLFVLRLFFEYETYYLHETAATDIRNVNEADFMPKVDNFTWEVISTNQEADALEAGGLEFRSQVTKARERLDKGAMAFCIFVGKELGSIAWIGRSEQAQASLSEPPYKVDFSNNEVCTGAHWTNPKYRRAGLRVYGSVKRRQFLSEKGIITTRGAIAKWNIAAQRSAKLSRNIYAEGRYLRILWWKSWKEKPLT